MDGDEGATSTWCRLGIAFLKGKQLLRAPSLLPLPPLPAPQLLLLLLPPPPPPSPLLLLPLPRLQLRLRWLPLSRPLALPLPVLLRHVCLPLSRLQCRLWQRLLLLLLRLLQNPL